MTRYNLLVSYNNENRTITINPSTKLAELVQKCLYIYDLSIDEISGISYFFIDANVYLNSDDENKLNLSYADFTQEYGDEINQFNICTSLLTSSQQFRKDYKNFSQNQNNLNTQTYFNHPTIHIINNYNSPNEPEQPQQPEQSQTQQPEQTQTNQNNNHNSYAFEFDYNYDPTRRQFYLNNQQTNSPFNDIMRSLGNSVLSSINRRNTQQQPNQQQPNQQQNTRQGFPVFGAAYSNINSYVDFLDNFQRIFNNQAFTNQGEQRVLRQNEIDSLSSGTYADLKNNNYILQDCTHCAITLEEFQNDTLVVSLPCKHAFKERAITTWLRNNSNKCPTCRAVVAEGVAREPTGFL